MHWSQPVGVLLTIIGLALLYILRGPLFHFIVILLEILGIVIGFLLILGGIALFFVGSRWVRRRPWNWGWGKTQT